MPRPDFVEAKARRDKYAELIADEVNANGTVQPHLAVAFADTAKLSYRRALRLSWSHDFLGEIKRIAEMKRRSDA